MLDERPARMSKRDSWASLLCDDAAYGEGASALALVGDLGVGDRLLRHRQRQPGGNEDTVLRVVLI